MRFLGFFVLSLVGCTSSRPSPSSNVSPVAAASSVTPADASAAPRPESANVVDAGVTEPAVPEPSFDEVANVLFTDRANVATATAPCPSSLPSDARVRCLYDERYRGDSKAAGLAHELFVRWRIIAGVEIGHTMDGGYRGMIRIEPAVPISAERKHLEWVVTAMRDFDQFFAELEKQPGSGPARPRYRFKPITLRFMRSVAARTPSAYAHDWEVAYNLAGSLNTSADAVRETLFHEVFHLNDAARPPPEGGAWSFATLQRTYDAIVKKCGARTPCLAPYTPNDTMVRNGTYYSFQPGNDVREYAAELALRYYREQRAALRSLPRTKSFKCGPPENVRSWEAMRDEFFGGIDAVPPCS
jgi:hypothetical protein